MIRDIESNEEYYQVIAFIEHIDTVIQKAYNDMAKYSDLNVITDFQDWIDRMKTKRMGYFNLASIYTIQSNNNNVKKYTCRHGDTLALISQAFYGNSDFGEYIYIENNLDTPILYPNQTLKIPLVHPENDKVYLKSFIEFLG